jgi:hypothetical protein
MEIGHRVKNAGYTKILYIQEVFLTNSNEIRNIYHEKTNGHNGKHTKLGFVITVLTWQKQTVYIDTYTHHMR